MSLWQSILKILTFQEPETQDPFELLETGEDKFLGAQNRRQNSPDHEPQPALKSPAAAGKDKADAPNQKKDPPTSRPDQTAGTKIDRQPTDVPTKPPVAKRVRRPVKPAKIENPQMADIIQTVYAQKKEEQAKKLQALAKEWPKEPAAANPSDSPTDSSKSRRKHRQRKDKQKTGAGQKPAPEDPGPSSSQKKNQAGAGRSAADPSLKPGDSQQAAETRPDSGSAENNSNNQSGDEENDQSQVQGVFTDLAQNLNYLADVYFWPTDLSLIAREFVVGTNPPLQALALYIEGLADPDRINQAIISPLMVFSELTSESEGEKTPDIKIIRQRLLPTATIQTKEKFSEIIEDISEGFTALFFQGIPQALVVESSGWPRRGVEQPVSERVIRGPQEGFNEDLAVNITMIRRLLRDPKLNREKLKIGQRAHNQCALLYIEDLANPALINEIKRRIESLDVDAVLSSGALEQLIQDSSWGIYPLSMATERPDRVVSSLLDGKAVIFLEGDPFALIYPSDVWSLLHAAEDASMPGPAVTLIRFIRWLSAGMLLFLPGMYLAIVGFHPEMLPTDLLLSIAANRERVPFPSVVEVLLMELAFELIREAGVRIPGIIGPTLGIVGAIILGQAAVAANLVNPIVIVIVAITGISSFSIPSHSLTITLRVYRFIYIFLGSTLGLLGIAAGVALQFILVVSLKSMGVPYLAPLGPFTFSNRDILIRGMLWTQERRPDYLGAQDQYRQAPISRKWILNPGNQGGEQQP